MMFCQIVVIGRRSAKCRLGTCDMVEQYCIVGMWSLASGRERFVPLSMTDGSSCFGKLCFSHGSEQKRDNCVWCISVWCLVNTQFHANCVHISLVQGGYLSVITLPGLIFLLHQKSTTWSCYFSWDNLHGECPKFNSEPYQCVLTCWDSSIPKGCRLLFMRKT